LNGNEEADDDDDRFLEQMREPRLVEVRGLHDADRLWSLIGHAVWVSVLYAAPPLIAAWIVFRRRDVTS
jgi:hypothetical protein